MPMNLTTCSELIHQVLGRTPPAAWPYSSIVDFAWTGFLNHRDWRWAAGTRYTLDLVADQARYDLPADLGQIIGVYGPETWSCGVILTSWTELERLRANGWTNPQGQPPFHAATRWTQQTDGSFIPQLELYPVPGAALADALEVSYLPASGQPQGNTDDLVLPFPPYIGPVWTLWLRACTLGLIEHDVAGVDDRLVPVIGGATMAAAINRDAGAIRRRKCPPGAAAESVTPIGRRRWYSRP